MTELSKSEILEIIPQKPPFRFIDEILALDDAGIVGACRFPKDASFYQGHFPGNPVTPGVILLEAMAQTGIVAYGLWLAAKEHGVEAIQNRLTLFTEADVEFTGMVYPGDRVIMRAEKRYFRNMKIKVTAEMKLESGKEVLRGTIAGMGVKAHAAT